MESLSPPSLPKRFEKRTVEDNTGNAWDMRRSSYHSLDIAPTSSPPDMNEINNKNNTAFNNNNNNFR
jgi:hypothetical protein